MKLIFYSSILCFVSLVTGLPASEYRGEEDFAGVDVMDEAKADERLLKDIADAEAKKVNRENLDAPRKRRACTQLGASCIRGSTKCCGDKGHDGHCGRSLGGCWFRDCCHVEKWTKDGEEVVEGIKDGAKKVETVLKLVGKGELVEGIKDGVNKGAKKVENVLKIVGNGIKEGEELVEGIKEKAKKVVNGVNKGAKKVENVLKLVGKGELVEGIKEGAKKVVNGVKKGAKKVENVLKKVGNGIKKGAEKVGNGIINGFKKVLGGKQS